MTQPFVIGGNPGQGGGGGGASQSPIQLNASLWYPAGAGQTVHSGKVVGWANFGTASSDANSALTTISLPTAPTLNASDAAYNNQPTLSFLAANTQAMQTVGALASTILAPLTVAWVGEWTALSGGAQFIFDDFTTEEKCCIFADSVPAIVMLSAANGEIITTAVPAGPGIFVAVFDGPNGQGMLYTASNLGYGPIPGAKAQTFSTAQLTGLTIGSLAAGAGLGDFYTGKLAEFAVFPFSLEQLQIGQLISYWAGKF